jgi:hypothetical protein
MKSKYFQASDGQRPHNQTYETQAYCIQQNHKNNYPRRSACLLLVSNNFLVLRVVPDDPIRNGVALYNEFIKKCFFNEFNKHIST